jgi:hypothetical protein
VNHTEKAMEIVKRHAYPDFWVEDMVKDFATALQQVEDQTIEGCAEVADSMHCTCSEYSKTCEGFEIAKAIRALGEAK